LAALHLDEVDLSLFVFKKFYRAVLVNFQPASQPACLALT
jgi:hypothetical protein